MDTRKIVLSLIGVALILFSIYGAKLLADSKDNRRPKAEKVIKTVFVDTVQNGTVPIVVRANGNLVAKHRVALFAEVQGIFQGSGKLFRPGQRYAKGETLIQIDAAEYYASVQSSKSNLFNLITSIMPDLRLDYPEVYPKWQAYLSGFDMDKTTPELPSMDTEKERFFITGRGIPTNYYQVKNMEQRLAKYTIRAPFGGVLTQALVTEGSLIRSGQQLGEFIDPGVYELEVFVGKRYGDLLEPGKEVALRAPETNKTYMGKVTRINGSVDQASQTIQAYIEVSGSSLKEGMYLEASLNAREEQDAISVDRSLVMDGDQIFVVRDSILDLVAVRPVHYTDKEVVLKDVPEGTVMVSRPVVGAYAGMLVTVFKEQTSK